MERIGAIIQARMGSSRLPGKVMMKAVGKPLLELLIERLSYSKIITEIIVATSINENDNVIAKFCEEKKVNYFRGSENDVLDRYYQAAKQFSITTVVRVTSDCPLIDPVLADDIIKFYINHKSEYDLVTNRYPLTYPDGLDVDVMSLKSLEYVWKNAATKSQREHTIPYFWENGMRVFNVEAEKNYFKNYRWTLDYNEDFLLISKLFNELYNPKQFPFSWKDVIALIKKYPHFSDINRMHLLK